MTRGCFCVLLASVMARAVSSSTTAGDQALCVGDDCIEDSSALQIFPWRQQQVAKQQSQTCLERVAAIATPGEVGQFQLRVVNYDNFWHVTCKASQQSLLLDPFFPPNKASFFGPLQTLEVEAEGFPDISIGSIKAQGIVTSVNAPDHADVPSLQALQKQIGKVPIFVASAQSPGSGLLATAVDDLVYGEPEQAELTKVSTRYPDCDPNEEGDMEFEEVGDFRICYAGKPDTFVQYRPVLIASACGVILHAPHGVVGPFDQNTLQAISKLRVGKSLVAIIGTSVTIAYGVPTSGFQPVQELLRQIQPDAFYDTHRQEYFTCGGIACDLLGSRVYAVVRVSPEDVCNAFPESYRGSPSRKDNPLQVPVFGEA